MNVQALEVSIGFPRLPRMLELPRKPSRTPAPSPTPGPGSGRADGIADRRSLLLAYTAASIAAGLGALVWTTLNVPVLPAIDTGLEGTVLGDPNGGVLLWIALGLVGSLRVLPIPGSSAVWTFHLPFVAAAMVLGGPTAGAWVGFVATIERRELESQPRYGMLANHAVLALGAVIGGLTVITVDRGLAGALVDPPVARLVAVVSGTLVLSVVTNGIAAGTIMLREHLTTVALVDIFIRSFGRVNLAEIGLAWLLVVAWAAIGWWAPLVIAAGVLLVWPEDLSIDSLTGLPLRSTFERDLDDLLSRSRRGLAPGGLLLSLDLVGFGAINKDPRFLETGGDEVLAQIGRRLGSVPRATDLISRRGGDEFAMFFTGLVDRRDAVRVAGRIETTVTQPVATSRGTISVGVSIGAVIVRPSPDIPSRQVLWDMANGAMQTQKGKQKTSRAGGPVTFYRDRRTGIRPQVSGPEGEASQGPSTNSRPGPLMLGGTLVAGVALVTLLVARLVQLLA
jgi:diguanylate cyclase (GGDEF)-like protein